MIKFQNTIIAKFTVNRPIGPVNLTLGAKFYRVGLVGENMRFWRVLGGQFGGHDF
jgi:hypothetical protein